MCFVDVRDVHSDIRKRVQNASTNEARSFNVGPGGEKYVELTSSSTTATIQMCTGKKINERK